MKREMTSPEMSAPTTASAASGDVPTSTVESVTTTETHSLSDK